VLFTIVDRAKRITNTEKAILLLTEEQTERLDFDTLVVRGRLDEHPQEWWEQRVVGSAPEAFANGTAMVEADQQTMLDRLLADPCAGRTRSVCCAPSTPVRTSSPTSRWSSSPSSRRSPPRAIENARLAEESRYVLSPASAIVSARRDARRHLAVAVQHLVGLELCKKLLARGEQTAVMDRLGELAGAPQRQHGRAEALHLRPQADEAPGARRYRCDRLLLRELTAGRAVKVI